jgi:hypothetical protein
MVGSLQPFLHAPHGKYPVLCAFWPNGKFSVVKYICSDAGTFLNEFRVSTCSVEIEKAAHILYLVFGKYHPSLGCGCERQDFMTKFGLFRKL